MCHAVFLINFNGPAGRSLPDRHGTKPRNVMGNSSDLNKPTTMGGKIRPFIPLIILYGFSVYLLSTVLLTDIALVRHHYIGFILLGVSTASFILKFPTGHLITGLTLIIGTFANASFTTSVQTFTLKLIFSIDFSWPYLLLLVLFVIINHKALPTWLRIAFVDKADHERKL